MIPIWNQEIFIRPFFKQLSSLDKVVALIATKPLLQYSDQHGYSDTPDNSEKILREEFPKVELYPSTHEGMFGCGLYNEGLKYVQDCDIVLRLDPDMLFTTKDWITFIDFIRNTDHDCYRMDFAKCSVNYYMTWDFDHGLKDAKEHDPLGVSPKKPYTGVLDYEAEREIEIKWDDWTCHHFRGWNKPKSVGKDWVKSEYAKEAFEKYSDNGRWYSAPQEIQDLWKK